MKERLGFVSNSSSCSFILVLPENREILDKDSTFRDWFKLESVLPEEIAPLREAVKETLERRTDMENLSLVIRYIGELIAEEGWILYRAKDPSDSTWNMADYEALKEDMDELLVLIRDKVMSLLFMEVGNSWEYDETRIRNGILQEDLGIEDRAKKVFKDHCYIFNNR